jgi:hypothetical protein
MVPFLGLDQNKRREIRVDPGWGLGYFAPPECSKNNVRPVFSEHSLPKHYPDLVTLTHVSQDQIIQVFRKKIGCRLVAIVDYAS